MHLSDTRKSRYTWFFHVNMSGHHKYRLLAGGHQAPEPIYSIYSGVVSTRLLEATKSLFQCAL